MTYRRRNDLAFIIVVILLLNILPNFVNCINFHWRFSCHCQIDWFCTSYNEHATHEINSCKSIYGIDFYTKGIEVIAFTAISGIKPRIINHGRQRLWLATRELGSGRRFQANLLAEHVSFNLLLKILPLHLYQVWRWLVTYIRLLLMTLLLQYNFNFCFIIIFCTFEELNSKFSCQFQSVDVKLWKDIIII